MPGRGARASVVADPRHAELLDQVMGIFDPEGAAKVPIPLRIQAADALGQAGDPRIDPTRKEYWGDIPAGNFLMGAQAEEPNDPNYDPQAPLSESPVHPVLLGAFHIARYPVTVGQFQQFIEHGGYEEPQYWQVAGGFGEYREPESWEEQQPYPTRPVVGVSWHEAMPVLSGERRRPAQGSRVGRSALAR